jgi:hypothetical protein
VNEFASERTTIIALASENNFISSDASHPQTLPESVLDRLLQDCVLYGFVLTPKINAEAHHA